MSLSNKKVYFDEGNHNIRILEETLSDNSKAYSIRIGESEYDCLNEKQAIDKYMELLKILSSLDKVS